MDNDIVPRTLLKRLVPVVLSLALECSAWSAEGVGVLTAEVREHRGAPALFVNGQPHTGLMFWVPDVLRPAGVACVAQFRDAGIHLISVPFRLDPCIQGPGQYEFGRFDAQMESLLKVNPDVLAMPRLDITPSEAWLDQNPEERMVHFDLAGKSSSNRGGGRISFSSRKWRTRMEPAIRAFIRHAEERYGEHMMGYHVGGGDCGEWSYMWADVLSDYSKPQQEAFRAWLRKRYEGDDKKLQAAWQDANVAFQTAEIPHDRARPGGAWSIMDPVKNRRISDYLVFHSEVVADAIIDFNGMVRSALREMGRTKVIATFYGYHFWFSGFACGYHNSGHHALAKVLASPDVDILCAPGNYQDRHPGGTFTSQLIAGSVRLHGKLFYNEDDTRTFMTPKGSAWGRCPDRASSIGVLRRNLVGTLTSGGTAWWMDQGIGWFNDAGLLEDIAAQRRLAEDLLRGDRSSTAQVAVIVSQESSRYMWYDGALTEASLVMQLSELGAMGAPFEVFDATDLERLFSRPEARNYRLVIFLNCLYLSPDERQAIRKHVARDGRTLLWVYAAGLITENAVSTDAMQEVTGIRTQLYDRNWPLEVVSFYTGDRHTYGTAEVVGPILNGNDPEATVRGWVRQHTHKDSYMPGLLEKDYGGWHSIWSAAPTVPAALLREMGRRAGVPIYSNCGDQVFTGPGLLAVHAAFDGKRTIRLPKPMTLKDVFTGETTAAEAGEFTVDMRRGDTRVWRPSE